jgi:hypothetical protein
MSDAEDFRDLHSKAVRHVLAQIAETTHAPAALQLAEAFAWLRNPGQSHGGAVTTTVTK